MQNLIIILLNIVLVFLSFILCWIKLMCNLFQLLFYYQNMLNYISFTTTVKRFQSSLGFAGNGQIKRKYPVSQSLDFWTSIWVCLDLFLWRDNWCFCSSVYYFLVLLSLVLGSLFCYVSSSSCLICLCLISFPVFSVSVFCSFVSPASQVSMSVYPPSYC